MLRDPALTTCVVVTLPETLPVSEAIELAQGVRKYEVPLAAVVLNRVPHDPFTVEERVALDAMELEPMRTLGARRVPRIDRAKAARIRLLDLEIPVRSVPELGLESDIAAAVAAALEGGPS